MLQLLLSSAKQTSALPFVDSSIFFQHLPTSLGTTFTKVFYREKLILYFASAQALSKSCNCVKCPNREFLLVRIFPHPYSARVLENTDQEKLRIWTFFTQCVLVKFFSGETGFFFFYFVDGSLIQPVQRSSKNVSYLQIWSLFC